MSRDCGTSVARGRSGYDSRLNSPGIFERVGRSASAPMADSSHRQSLPALGDTAACAALGIDCRCLSSSWREDNAPAALASESCTASPCHMDLNGRHLTASIGGGYMTHLQNAEARRGGRARFPFWDGSNLCQASGRWQGGAGGSIIMDLLGPTAFPRRCGAGPRKALGRTTARGAGSIG